MRALVLVGLLGAVAAAEPRAAGSPWLDEPGATLPVSRPEVSNDDNGDADVDDDDDDDVPRSRLYLAAMLGNRGDQGGLVDSGYRFVAIVGGAVGPVNLSLAIDQQLGADNRIAGTEDDPATFSEWVASARAGWRFGIGPDFWILTNLGIARVDTSVTRLDSMRSANRGTLGFDGVLTVVWRSGRIASTVVVGATAIPTARQLVIDGVTYESPRRIEPWVGLGVALLVL